MSVWESREALADFVYRSAHTPVMRRRREWIYKMAEQHFVLWWVPAGHIPSTEEARERLEHLRAHGPAPHAFTLPAPLPPPSAFPSREPFPPPGAVDAAEARDDDLCPV